MENRQVQSCDGPVTPGESSMMVSGVKLTNDGMFVSNEWCVTVFYIPEKQNIMHIKSYIQVRKTVE